MTFEFIVKDKKKEMFKICYEDGCICIDKNFTESQAEQAFDELNTIPKETTEESSEPNQYGGVRKHMAAIVREFNPYGGREKCCESTKNTFNKILGVDSFLKESSFEKDFNVGDWEDPIELEIFKTIYDGFDEARQSMLQKHGQNKTNPVVQNVVEELNDIFGSDTTQYAFEE